MTQLGPRQQIALRFAARLVPRGQRDAWLQEWHGELAALAARTEGWPAQRRRLLGSALRVAWRDALWLRLHPERDDERPIHALHSPVGDPGGSFWTTLGRDVTFGLRRLRRSPGFTLTVLGFLSLSIAATTLVFAVLNSIVLEPLAYAEADRLVRIVGYDTGEGQEDWMSMNEVLLLRENARTFEAVGHSTTFPATWERDDGRQRIQRGYVSPEYFALLGIDALHGRLLGSGEDDRTGVVLSYEFWRQELQGDPDIVGSSLRIDDRALTIVGVASPSTYTHDFSTPPADIWLRDRPPRPDDDLDFRIFTAVARLADGQDLAAARSESAALEAQLAADRPDLYGGWQLRLEPLKETVVGQAGRPLVLLFACLGLLLFGICANLANLVMARLLGRRDEILVHLALGGRRTAIARQLAIEGAVLSVAGGAFGLLLAQQGLSWLPSWLSFDLPRSTEIALGWEGPAFTAAVTAMMTILFAWLPARFGARAGLAQDLRSGRRTTGRGVARLRSLMISAQVAVALPLLIVAGLLAGGLSDLRTADLGLRPDGLAGLRVSVPFQQAPEPAQRIQYFTDLAASARSRPDVSHAAATLQMPLVLHQADRSRIRVVDLPADADSAPRALYQVVTAGYFDTLEVPLLAGRDFGTEDGHDTSPVVIINRTLMERHFAGLDPLGRQIDVELSITGEPTLRTVVGVVEDIAQLGPALPIEPMVFLPHAQVPFPSMTVVVRGAGPLRGPLRHLREQALSAQPTATVEPPVLAEDAARELLGPFRSAARLATVFALFAAALSLLGLYGLLSYDVQQSRRECAIRMAIGASRGAIRLHFLRRGALLVAYGLGLGLLLSWLAARLLSGAVGAVPVFDPLVFVAVPLGLAAVAAIAGWLPANRAIRTSPATMLRAE